MATIEEVLYKAKTVAESAGKKTGELVDQVRLKMDIAQTEKELSAAYEELGRRVYDAYRANEELLPLLEEINAQVAELNEKAAAMRQQLDEYKNVCRCAACGEANTEDSLYCKKCGQPLAK